MNILFTKFTKSSIFFCLLLFFSLPNFAQTVIYVNDNATGANNGSSWINAYTDLQSAIGAAVSGTQIWVKEGTYKPSSIGNKTAFFEIKPDVKLYGGFPDATINPRISDRNWETNLTILSGDLNGSGGVDASDSYHVVKSISGNANSLLNGFFIKHGCANDIGVDANGAGMYLLGTPVISECKIMENQASETGGGIFVGTGAFPKLKEIEVENNFATIGGGGLAVVLGDVSIRYSVFKNNITNQTGGAIYADNATTVNIFASTFVTNAADANGGAVYLFGGSNCNLYNSYLISNISNNNGGGVCNQSSTLNAFNTIFSQNRGNSASSKGGGLFSIGTATSNIVNCNFYKNECLTSTGAGGAHNSIGATTAAKNVIFWENVNLSTPVESDQIGNDAATADFTFNHCLSQNWLAGLVANVSEISSTISTSPQFTDALNGNFSLACASPAREAGTSVIPSSDVIDADADGNTTETYPYDFAFKPRIEGLINIGAFEDYIRYYVNKTATGSAAGGSWLNAFPELATALADTELVGAITGAPACKVELWVAKGTYFPDAAAPGSRTESFNLKSNLEIYGGFLGDEILRGERDYNANITILSGDINTVGTDTDNSYHVVSALSTDATAMLDGFYIQKGYADGATSPEDFGGGLYMNNASPLIKNCLFFNNKAKSGGGAVKIAVGNPIFRDCTFFNNQTLVSTTNGGAVEISDAATFVYCTFKSNRTFAGGTSLGGAVFFNGTGNLLLSGCNFKSNTSNAAGAMGINAASPAVVKIQNTVFDSNTASTLDGGAILFNGNASLTLANCNFYGNSATVGSGGAITLNGNPPTIVNNSIFWNNTKVGGVFSNIDNIGTLYTITVNNSIAEDAAATSITNLTPSSVFSESDPLFFAPEIGDFRLTGCSPAIDAALGTASGTDDFADADDDGFSTGSVLLDALKNNRIFNTSMDMGAVEMQYIPTTSSNLYVKLGGLGDGSSWDSPLGNLREALARACSVGAQVWVAAGTYTPDDCTTCALSDRSKSFILPEGVKMYGGFDAASTGPGALTTQNTTLYPTILSGNIGDAALNTDNSYFVVKVINNAQGATIDGVTIQDAYGDDALSINVGGGLVLKASGATTPVVLNNIIFKDNSAKDGGGLSMLELSKATGTKLIFENNIATGTSPLGHGGAISLRGSSNFTLDQSKMYGNSATASTGFGGAIYSNTSTLLAQNTLMYSNIAADGGAIYQMDGNITLTNITITKNTSDVGNFALKQAGTSNIITVKNTIIWNNLLGGQVSNGSGAGMTFLNSLVQGGCPGGIVTCTATIDADPLFIDETVNNYRLKGCSPAMDSGDDASAPTTNDLDNLPRSVNLLSLSNNVDMGAYEAQTLVRNTIYVDINRAGLGTGESWENAYNFLQDALNDPQGCKQIFVANGAVLVYSPETEFSAGDTRSRTFNLTQNNTKIIGGFAAGLMGTSLITDSNPIANETIISGDFADDDNGFANNGENAYHLFRIENLTDIEISGFTIKGGNANSVTFTTDQKGGGIYANNVKLLNINKCKFTHNNATSGGGIYFTSSTNEGLITNCQFYANKASSFGGAISAFNAHYQLVNSAFIGNRVSGAGGAISIDNAAASVGVTNCTFSENGGGTAGNNIYETLSATPIITNSNFWASALPVNSGLLIYSNNNSQGGAFAGTANISSDPFYTRNPSAGADGVWGTADDNFGDLRPLSCSPLIDAADYFAISDYISLNDLAQEARVFPSLGLPDIGAYEANATSTFPAVNIFTSSVSALAVTLNWTYPTSSIDVDNFQIERRILGGTFAPISGSPFLGTSTSTINTVPAAGTYEYRIRAVRGTTCFSAWNTISVNTTFVPCPEIIAVVTMSPVITSCDSVLVPVLLHGYVNLDSTARISVRYGTPSATIDEVIIIDSVATSGYFSIMVNLAGGTDYWYALEGMHNCDGEITLGNIVAFSTPVAVDVNDIGEDISICAGEEIPAIGDILPDGVEILWQSSVDSLVWEDLYDQVEEQLIPFVPTESIYLRRLVTSETCENYSNVVFVNILERFINPADSLILVQIYNETNGDDWHEPWDLSAPVIEWAGVEICNGLVINLDLPYNNLTGAFPASATSLGLNRLTLDGNALEFNSLEPFVGAVPHFTYIPQEAINESFDTTVVEGTNLVLTANALGNYNLYQWQKDSISIVGETNDSLIINNIGFAHAGVYQTVVTNSLATGLTLLRRELTVHVSPRAVNPSDSLILVAIYEATNGADWLESWNLYEPVNTWAGIEFDELGRISRIDLSNNNLTGFLPDVFNNDTSQIITSLKYLSFFGNQISGTIPASLGGLQSLEYLDLAQNKFEGSVPTSLGGLSNLLTLALSDNQLTDLPESIGDLPNLKTLLVAGNLFNTIPESIGNLTNLLTLDVSENALKRLPASLTNLSKLEILLAKHNQIDELPSDLSALTNLENLQVNGNFLKKLPSLTFSKLDFLALDNNYLEFDDLLPIKNLAKIAFDYAPQADINEIEEYTVSLKQHIDFQVLTNGNGNRYRWVKDEIELTDEAYSATFSLVYVRARDRGVYYAKVTNPNLPKLTLYRHPITLFINCNELYKTQIKTYDALAACAGAPINVRMAVENENNIIAYQWYKNQMPLKLSTNSVFTATDTGAYFVMATYKDGCTVASNSFNVRLNDAFLTISADGANLSAQTNANITSYQWVKDNVYLSNGVEAEFLVRDVGEYQLIAVDEFGCTLTSNKVFVGVTETKNEEKLDLMLFPNPAKDYVFVQFENYEKAKIVVTDAIGRIMINTEAEGKEIKLSTAHFPLGIYLVEITTTKGRETVKLVKD